MIPTWEILGAWLAVAMTLFILSFLYRDNPFYKFAEHVYVGISLGYMVVFYIWRVLIPDLFEPLLFEGKFLVIIPGALGILALSRLIPKLNWMSRPTFAFLMGYGAGMAIPNAVEAFVLKHSQSTVTPIGNWTAGVHWFTVFSDVLIIVILLCCLIYFFFSIEHKGPVRIAAKAGILFLMIQFGIAYGNTVMGRMSLLYGRFWDLKTYGGASYYYATPTILIGLVTGIVIFTLKERGKTPPGGEGLTPEPASPPEPGPEPAKPEPPDKPEA